MPTVGTNIFIQWNYLHIFSPLGTWTWFLPRPYIHSHPLCHFLHSCLYLEYLSRSFSTDWNVTYLSLPELLMDRTLCYGNLWYMETFPDTVGQYVITDIIVYISISSDATQLNSQWSWYRHQRTFSPSLQPGNGFFKGKNHVLSPFLFHIISYLSEQNIVGVLILSVCCVW